MATPKKISQLTAVVTPAGTDTLAAVQGSTTKKLTVTQLLTLAGSASFELKTDNYTLVASDRIIITAATAKTITVAATIAASDEFIVHNASSSAGVVSIEPNTGHTISGPGGDAVGGTDTITLAAGETIRLVAVSASVLEIV
jgi:hypothetical protein